MVKQSIYTVKEGDILRCPRCHKNESRIVDNWPNEDGSFIHRRRECIHCGFRLTIFERYEETPLLMIKKDGTHQEFSHQKILNGIIHSAEKRPASTERLTRIADKVEEQIRSIDESEISSQTTDKFVMDELRGVGEIAHTRFASICRQFKDVNVFMSELETMMKAEHKK